MLVLSACRRVLVSRRAGAVFLALLAFAGLEALLILFVDKPVSLAFRDLEAAFPDLKAFFAAITDMAKGKWVLMIATLAGLAGLGLSFLPGLRERTIARLRRCAAVGGVLAASTLVSGAITDTLKLMIGRARPKLLEQQGFYGFDPFTLETDFRSFPSGHATTACAIAVTVGALFPRSRPYIWIWALLMMLSRLVINAHYLADVLAGSLIGTLAALGVVAFCRKRGWVFTKKSP